MPAPRHSLDRRAFLAAAASSALHGASAQTRPIPIIDTHIHLYDPTRPQGAPYPNPNNPAVYIPTLPERYRRAAAPLGVVGAIEVEASPWIEDNLWVLEVSEKEPFMVGTIGNLEPGKPEFGEYLDRYHRNPLFRGIRYGNVWGRNLGAELAKPEFIAGLKGLADAGLILETANPRPDLIEAVVRVTDRVPNLPIVIDHMGVLTPPADAAARKALDANLLELKGRPQVYAKVSEVLRRVDGKVVTDPDVYKPRLDLLWDTFGEDRLVFGSDWPNSAGNWASLVEALKVVQDYFATKGRAASEKYFWKNSVAAYHWVKRDPSQPVIG
jgi:L-fuconolactonase